MNHYTFTYLQIKKPKSRSIYNGLLNSWEEKEIKQNIFGKDLVETDGIFEVYKNSKTEIIRQWMGKEKMS